jgi:quercetin 2,3-dioxygenase
MTIVRADERYRSVQDGIETWHCFAASGHYDAENVSWGALIGCDEHIVAPGGGFDWHPHRGVDIVSWVLSGRLRHEDAQGARLVGPGQVLWQATGSGIRHRETNASAARALRVIQMTLLASDAAPAVRLGEPPLSVGASRFDVWTSTCSIVAPRWHVLVGRGRWQLRNLALSEGDSVRGTDRLSVAGSGELLVWSL